MILSKAVFPCHQIFDLETTDQLPGTEDTGDTFIWTTLIFPFRCIQCDISNGLYPDLSSSYYLLNPTLSVEGWGFLITRVLVFHNMKKFDFIGCHLVFLWFFFLDIFSYLSLPLSMGPSFKVFLSWSSVKIPFLTSCPTTEVIINH